jgi:hypothetical protein
MYSKPLIEYNQVVGFDHPSSRSVRDKLQTLDTVTENEALRGVEEPAHDSRGKTLHLGSKRASSKSDRNVLLKKLGLR